MGKRADQFKHWVESGQAPGIGQLNRQLEYQIKNRPKYEVQDQYLDNQALATARAFGADREAQMARENVDQQIANTVGMAKNISGSTGSILDTLRAVTDSGFAAKRGIAQDEAAMRGAKVGELYGANAALAEERDKAWNYNINQPHQLKIQQLREKRKFRQELLMKGLDLAGTLATGGMYRGSGGGGGYDPAPAAAGYSAGGYGPYWDDNTGGVVTGWH